MQLNKAMIERARLRRCMTQGELAAAAEISRVTLYRALKEGRAGVRTARRLCAVLGLAPEAIWVLSDEGTR